MVGQAHHGAELETRIIQVGRDLSAALGAVLTSVPGGPHGPTSLARKLDVDAVLTCRLMKAVRDSDALAVMRRTPGPVPLRRLLRAAAGAGVDSTLIGEAEIAVAAFDHLLRGEAGGRRSLDSMISAWLPEARLDFELRAKKAAFRSMSDVKGACADMHVLTFLLHPNEDGRHIDYVWLFGLLGLRRMRAGVPVHFATTNTAHQPLPPRETRTLDGRPLGDLAQGLLPEFCSTPTPSLHVETSGDSVHYTLADRGFGPRSAADLVCASLNVRARRLHDEPGHDRLTFYYAQVRTPVARLQFDVLLHRDVYPLAAPGLAVYDTSIRGTADVNDPSRDADRYALSERIDDLGPRIAAFRSSDVPAYRDLLRRVCAATGWDENEFRGYRCAIECPIYGSQAVMSFKPPTVERA